VDDKTRTWEKTKTCQGLFILVVKAARGDTKTQKSEFVIFNFDSDGKAL
jgi:hypothetical protein